MLKCSLQVQVVRVPLQCLTCAEGVCWEFSHCLILAKGPPLKSCPCLSPFPPCPSPAAPLLVPHRGTCELSLVSLLMFSRERSSPEQSLDVSVGTGPVESSSACRSWCWEEEGSAGAQPPVWAWLAPDCAPGPGSGRTQSVLGAASGPRAGRAEGGSAFPDLSPVCAPAAASKARARSSPGESRETPAIRAGSNQCGLRIVWHTLKLELCFWATESTNETLKRDEDLFWVSCPVFAKSVWVKGKPFPDCAFMAKWNSCEVTISKGE